MEQNLINMGELGDVVVSIEKLLENYNNLEKDLILRELRGRFDARNRQIKANEISSNAIEKILPKSLLGMLKKDKQAEND